MRPCGLGVFGVMSYVRLLWLFARVVSFVHVLGFQWCVHIVLTSVESLTNVRLFNSLNAGQAEDALDPQIV